MRRQLEIFSLWLPVGGYMALIYFLSSQSTVRFARRFPDGLLHGAEFFLLAILLARAVNGGLLAPMQPRCYLWSFVLSSHYALLDELHQLLVPGRVSSAVDLLADMVGIDLALAGVFLLQQALLSRRLDPGSTTR